MQRVLPDMSASYVSVPIVTMAYSLSPDASDPESPPSSVLAAVVVVVSSPAVVVAPSAVVVVAAGSSSDESLLHAAASVRIATARITIRARAGRWVECRWVRGMGVSGRSLGGSTICQPYAIPFRRA